MTSSIKKKQSPQVPPSAPPAKAAAVKQLDRAALTKVLKALDQQHRAVEGLNKKLLKKLLAIDPDLLSPTRLAPDSPARAKLESAAQRFIHDHQADYAALETAAAKAAEALSNPLVEKAILANDARSAPLVEQVINAYRVIANTQSAGASLAWAERVLADKDNADPKLYRAFAKDDAAFDVELAATVVIPALPHVAARYYEETGRDAAKAAHKVALGTTASLAAIRMAAVIFDAGSVTKALGSSSDAIGRLAAVFSGTSTLMKVMWGPGNALGMAGAVLEIYEGRYLNGLRYGTGSASGLVTLTAAAAQAFKEDPHASSFASKTANRLMNGTTGQLLRGAATAAPAAAGLSSVFAFAEHRQRPESVGNNVSLIGDATAIVGATAALSANLTKNPVNAVKLARFGLLSWYGVGLIVGGELYQVGETLHEKSRNASAVSDFDGLTIVLGLKKSVMPGVD
ncbi:MAG: hypothetical protein K1X64_16325 [Myxococcaceae bacterium]|nr:hypothetical protein [Myxococcaceae bacterium]